VVKRPPTTCSDKNHQENHRKRPTNGQGQNEAGSKKKIRNGRTSPRPAHRAQERAALRRSGEGATRPSRKKSFSFKKIPMLARMEEEVDVGGSIGEGNTAKFRKRSTSSGHVTRVQEKGSE